MSLGKPSNNLQQPVIEEAYLSNWGVLKYAMRGVPITEKYTGVPWVSLITPNFPAVFSLMAGFLYLIPGIVYSMFSGAGEAGNVAIGTKVIGIAGTLIMIAVAACIINLVLFGWCSVVLVLFRRITNTRIKITPRAQRITYFAALYPPIHFLSTAMLTVLHSAQYRNGWIVQCEIIGFVAVVLLVFALVMRLLTVFQGMRREANGSVWIGGLGIVGCVDVWLILYSLLFEYLLGDYIG